MICQGCRNPEAFRIRRYGDGMELCNECGVAGSVHLPDLFVDGKPEENLPDDPRTGKAPVFSTRGEKERFLRAHHLVEARGLEHGGPAIPHAVPVPNKDQRRHDARMAIKRVREMGQDVRRQSYIRILKEQGRA